MATLERLPLEALQQICDHVASGYKPSVYDFALVCKRWSLASNKVRFQRVRLIVESRAKLSEDLDRWNTVLGSTSSLRCVRRLEIQGELPALSDEGMVTRRAPERPGNSLADIDDALDSLQHTTYVGFPMPPENTEEEDKDWTPVARFLIQLQALQDLVYNCKSRFPPCLLEALHKHLPVCRLHLHSFGLLSLIQSTTRPQDLDQYGYDLATSPSLYCIVYQEHRIDCRQLADYNDIAIRRISTGLAPNLRQVHMIVYLEPGATLDTGDIHRRRPERGFFLSNGSKPSSLGELHSLSFRHGMFAELGQWNEHIAISSLRELRLECGIDPETLKLARTYDFRSLETLVLSLNAAWGESRDLDEAASDFLQTLPPLHTLKLTGHWSRKSFQAILVHHTSLHRIWLSIIRARSISMFGLEFVLTLDRIKELASRCLELKKATFLIPRTQGNIHEVRIYRALGYLSGLEDLSLHLDCYDYTYPQLDEAVLEDLPENFNKLQNIFTNNALDDSLARSIFEKIYETQSKRGKPTLQRLRIQSIGPGYFFTRITPNDLLDILDVISCGREVVRNPTQRDDCDDIVVQKHCRRQVLGDLKPKFVIYRKVFRKLWPEKTGVWQNDWHSFPLASDEELAAPTA
ncbi:hypothetical protein FQN49_006492 [Arthroderma sp. PD_2]|nr:hypothetical protein FQN49_006492 [Arthroderma sp. PD_2]